MTEPNLDEQLDDLFQVFTYEDVDTGSVGIQFVSKTNRIWISEKEWIDKKATIKALIATQVEQARGCVDCKKLRCENCERLWQT